MQNAISSMQVYFFGDSICFGQGVSPHQSWVVRIAEQLAKVGRERAVAITAQNPSINGNTTRQALERIAYDLQSHRPDLVLVQFGMNDCNYWESDRGLPRVSIKAFAANLDEIVDRAARFGARGVLMLTNHLSGRDRDNLPHVGFTYEQSNRRYNAVIREVAAGRRPLVRLIDVEAAFLERTRGEQEKLRCLLKPDLLHLSEAGHDLYYEHVLPAVLSSAEAILGARGA